jgi:hypothetical protein
MDAGLRQSKLQTLAEYEGYLVLEEMLAAVMVDSVSPGICTNPDCNYTTEVEPDQTGGWCEECGERSVASALILAQII